MPVSTSPQQLRFHAYISFHLQSKPTTMTRFLFVVFSSRLWWSWTLLFSLDRVAALISSDGQALLQFKAAILSDPASTLLSWNASDQNPCSWTGVSCSSDKSHVVALSLPRAGLLGSLSPDLGRLLHLRHLNLHDNHFLGSIPAGLFNASQIQSLFLFSNGLSGALPQDVGKLAQLQYLDLSDNALAGRIPDTVANCTRLRSLLLRQNSFMGAIPEDVGSSLTSLKRLDLSSNSLSGSIPPSLSGLQSLVGTLNLSHNHLSGSIPASLGNLPRNLTLDLSNNDLTGPIPRNGIFSGQNTSAFLGNLGLCGAPLEIPCTTYSPSPSPLTSPFKTGATGTRAAHRGKGISRRAIVAIAIVHAAGIVLIGCVFLYFCRRKCTREFLKPSSSSSPAGAASSTEGAWISSGRATGIHEKFEQGKLVALDAELSFDLEELLKASAYVLGKSGAGIVYKVVLADGLTVAVRRLGDGGLHRFREFQNLVETIARIRHSNIVNLRACYWSVDEKLLIYDFIPNGSMASALRDQYLDASEPLTWSSRLKIAKGTARGLAYLHEYSSRKYVHGDVKPSNILLDLDMKPYVADFGLSQLLSIAGSGVPTPAHGRSGSNRNGASYSYEIPTSPSDSHYQAPEASTSTKPTQKWDVYSFGMVLLELLTNKSPVQSSSSGVDLTQWIKAASEDRKPLLQVLDPVLCDETDRADEMLGVFQVALGCVAVTADYRPTMRQVADTLGSIRPNIL